MQDILTLKGDGMEWNGMEFINISIGITIQSLSDCFSM